MIDRPGETLGDLTAALQLEQRPVLLLDVLVLALGLAEIEGAHGSSGDHGQAGQYPKQVGPEPVDLVQALNGYPQLRLTAVYPALVPPPRALAPRVCGLRRGGRDPAGALDPEKCAACGLDHDPRTGEALPSARGCRLSLLLSPQPCLSRRRPRERVP